MRFYFGCATLIFFLTCTLFINVSITVGEESNSTITSLPVYSTTVTAPNSLLPVGQSRLKEQLLLDQLSEETSVSINKNDSITVSTTMQLSLIDIAQAIASFASLGALLFLLWQNILLQSQTKSLNQSIRSATYQNIVSHYVDINKSLVTNTEIAEAFASFNDCNYAYSTEQERRREWLAWWLLNHYENAYMQYNLGSLPKHMWKGIEVDCINQIKKPYILQLWQRSQYLFSEDFKSFIASALLKENSTS